MSATTHRTKTPPGRISGIESLTPRTVPVVLLIVLALLFFCKVIVQTKPLYGSDFILQFYPWKKFLYDSFRSLHQIPLWNPHVLSGTPFLANIQTSIFYPGGFLFYLIPPEYAYGYTVILHAMASGMFMYLFVRYLAVNRPGAFLAASIFTYNGFFMGHLYAGHLTFVQNYIWIPLIFLFICKFLDTTCMKYSILAGLLLGIQILGGFPQIAFYTILASLFLAIYQMTRSFGTGVRNRTHTLGLGMTLTLLFAIGIAAVQLLPTYEFSQLSTRTGGVPYDFATMDSFDPIHLLTFVFPNFFGNPANGSYWKSNDVHQFWELCGFVGIAPLFLLCLLRKKPYGFKLQTFFFLLVLLSLFLSLGRYNPFYPLIHKLPGFSHFRIPAQILYLYVFSVSVLSGMGLHQYTMYGARTTAFKVAVILSAIFLCLMLTMFTLLQFQSFTFLLKVVRPDAFPFELMAQLCKTVQLSIYTGAAFFFATMALIYCHQKGFLQAKYAIAGLILIALVDLWRFSSPLIRTMEWPPSKAKKSITETLDQSLGLGRTITPNSLFHPNDAMVYGYEDIEGYDPLILKRYVEYIHKSQNVAADPVSAVHVGNVHDPKNDLIRLLNVTRQLMPSGDVIQVENAFPRAFVVHNSVRRDSQHILDYMTGSDFDPTKTVVLDRRATNAMLASARDSRAHSLESKIHMSPDDFKNSSYQITRYDNARIEMNVSMADNGYLVLSEIDYPGWRAYVDNERADILNGNYILRTLPLRQGQHEVAFKFEPVSFRIGLTISICAVTLLIAFLGIPSAFRIVSGSGNRRSRGPIG